MTRISVIGCGNMGGAFIKGLAGSEHYVIGCDVDESVLATIEDYCDETTTDSSVAETADVVILAVKPDLVGVVLSDLDLDADQTLISIAAGVSTDIIESQTDARVVRIMPNLAAQYGMMAAAVTESTITDEVRAILSEVGEFVEIPESQMDIATAVNGSGPAFVFYLINAMADAGVDGGLDPEDARVLAAQTFKGAAETVLNSDESIEDLIDAVCSPNGTTIEGMESLWDSTVETDVGQAVAAAEERSEELAQEATDE